jgi:S-adenosylmethionine:tRNA ribosyltransferase-isomerase
MVQVPAGLRAALPAELRGLRRDGARLVVVDRRARTVAHTTVAQLGEHLGAGDALVVNSSRTVPAALNGWREDGTPVQIRPWVRRERSWDALAVQAEPPYAPVELRPGEHLRFDGGLVLHVAGRREDLTALWTLAVVAGTGLDTLLRHGEAVRYSYVPEPVALEHYQTVYAGIPGSAETPSAGRHLTWQLLLELRRRGVALADLVLHTGLSSTQDDDLDRSHPLVEEWFEIPASTAEAVARAARVVAVGTSVVRALETAGDVDAATGRRRIAAGARWTDLMVSAERGVHVVDGLLTGLHESGGSHLELLRAFVDDALLDRAYAEAVDRGYLWHEFGDAMLVL